MRETKPSLRHTMIRTEGIIMIRLIALHGRLNGSVVLKSSGGKTEFMLKTRSPVQKGADGTLTAFLIAPSSGGFRIVKSEVINGAGSAQIDGVRGIVISNGAAILAEGANGLSDTALEHAKVRLRLEFPFADKHSPERDKAFERNVVDARQADEPGGNAKAPNAGEVPNTEAIPAEAAGVSPVTRRILSQAKALFGSGDADAFLFDEAPPLEAKPPPAERNTEPYSPDSEAVKNPFPALFPNSTWRKKADEPALLGKLKHRGRLYSVTALPREGRFPPNELAEFSNIRRAKAEDGTQYWLGIKRL